MKHGILMVGLGAAILAGAAGQGMAESHGKGPHHGQRPSFEELDANADGHLTREEMQARQAERRERHLDYMFEMHDGDADGALSMAEMSEMRGAKRGQMFQRVDADGDGRISRAEFDEMRATHGKHHRAREGRKNMQE